MTKELLKFTLRDAFLVLLLPFVIYSILIVLLKKTPLENALWLWNASIFISEAIGFVFLALKYGYYSILIGLVYLPGMYFLMSWYTLRFVGLVFGDWL